MYGQPAKAMVSARSQPAFLLARRWQACQTLRQAWLSSTLYPGPLPSVEDANALGFNAVATPISGAGAAMAFERSAEGCLALVAHRNGDFRQGHGRA